MKALVSVSLSMPNVPSPGGQLPCNAQLAPPYMAACSPYGERASLMLELAKLMNCVGYRGRGKLVVECVHRELGGQAPGCLTSNSVTWVQGVESPLVHVPGCRALCQVTLWVGPCPGRIACLCELDRVSWCVCGYGRRWGFTSFSFSKKAGLVIHPP